MNWAIKIMTYILVAALSAVGGSILTRHLLTTKQETPEVIKQIIDKPLEKYSIENLATTNIVKNEIKIENVISQEKDYTSYLFSYQFDPTLTNKPTKKVTGQVNIPKGDGPFPLVFMVRGYVDPEIYQTGVGTRRVGEQLAQNGFMTIAPDYLGYAGSDGNAADTLESRFQTYTTTLSILKSSEDLPQWDHKNLFIWAHSNGGQITLTTLAITQLTAPTVLWAPVSKPFPYSVLYYTDDSIDKGKFLRGEIADFEELYDVNKYSFDNYLNRIKAPIQINQGTADGAVPVSWSSSLASLLKKQNVEVEYHTYQGADHNLNPSWDEAVENTLEFYKKYLQ